MNSNEEIGLPNSRKRERKFYLKYIISVFDVSLRKGRKPLDKIRTTKRSCSSRKKYVHWQDNIFRFQKVKRFSVMSWSHVQSKCVP